jgi:threonine dehydrogenase-like Zn-dependent dehydrogenase
MSVRVTTFAGPGARPEMHTVERPQLGDRSGLIAIDACGVCGTDLHILAGHWPKPLPWPFTLGHEWAGRLVGKGAGLETDCMGAPLEVGCRVTLPPLSPCGVCAYCRRWPEHANKCLNPVYYGRYIPFSKAPHLWGGWAELVYVDLDMFPGTRLFRLPDDMDPMLGSLSEPLACCLRALRRAAEAGGFTYGDTVVVQGTGPIGVLMVAAAREMGAGRVIAAGAPEKPRLALARAFGADATVDIDRSTTAGQRVEAVRDLVGGFGADVVVDCAGHPAVGPEGVEMLRDGGTYVEMGQFTDAGSIDTNWHRICSRDMILVSSWGLTPQDMPPAIELLDRARDRYPWPSMQTEFPFTVDGVFEAVECARQMRCVKATIALRETV